MKQWKNESVQILLEKYGGTDPIETIKEATRELVLQAFQKGWKGPPFDPIILAKILGIGVYPNESVKDARIIPDGKKNLRIEYNPLQRTSRANFSISHEIGHSLFPDCGEVIRNREEERDAENWELEFLCNISASEILLPYAVFANESNNVPLHLDSLLDIANKYQASLEAVFLRFCEVVDKPCAIILCTFDEDGQLVVDYSKSSRSFPQGVPTGFIVPEFSKVYECINSGWTAYDNELWDVFGEIKHQIYAIGLPPLKRHKKQRVGIFVVPKDHAQSQEGKLYMIYGDATELRGEGTKIIAQTLNTYAGLGFGFGRSMAVRWPKSKQVVQAWKQQNNGLKLGDSKLTQLSNDTYVFQFVVQKGIRPKKGEILLNYKSLRSGLQELAYEAERLNASVHMPQIGAGQAGGDWKIIEGMIHDELNIKEIDVTVYLLPGKRVSKRRNRPTLTLFDEDSLYEDI